MTTPSLRWSSVRDCARKAVYEATGAPARDRTVAEERQLARGRSVGHDYVIAIANANGRKVHVASGPDYMLPYPEHRAANEDTADILAELPVQWELGTGHADAYVRDTDTVIEILSSQSATGDMIHSKLLQAGGYARCLDATSVAVAIVDPATLDDERVIVTAKSRRWAELMAEVDERIRLVLAWRDTGIIPARVCRKPGDAWGHFCLHAAHCFQDWEAPPVEQLDTPEAVELAARLAHLKAQRRTVSAQDKLLEQRQKEIQTELAEHVDQGERRIGNYVVKRSIRAGRRRFDFDRADLDSRIPDDVLAEFVKTGSSYSVWDVEQQGPVEAPDFGEAPF